MGKLYICKGLPASGKTFWARKFVEDRGFRAVRVNRDDLRMMAHNGGYSPERELFVVRAALGMIAQALQYGYDVVSDDTNLRNHICEQLLTVAAVCNYQVEWVLFETPLNVCIERDKQRDRPVGEHTIRSMSLSSDLMTVAMLALPATVVSSTGTERHLNTPWKQGGPEHVPTAVDS